MLGLVFLIPLFVFFINKHYKIKQLLLITFSFPTLFLFLWFLKNILISGCMIYPLKATCINNLNWTNFTQITEDKILGSAWSKGWPDRIDKKISMYEYNKNFNWVKSWSKTHFKYILKTILPFIIILTIISLYLIFFAKNTLVKNKEDFKLKIILLIIFCLFGLISFFTIFPIYRYGYSYLITIISLIVIYLNKNKIGLKQNIFIFKFFFIICITSLITKQFVKISKNYSQKEIWPNIYSLSEKNNSYKKIILNENFHYYYAYNGDNLCMYSTSPCTSYKLNTNIIASKKFNYDIISLKSKYD